MMSVKTPVCINDKIVKTGCYCLNESTPNQFTNLLCGDNTLGVRSDTDEQLILHVPLVQTFELSHISLGVPGDGSCPATVKLYANANNLCFSSINDTPATQVAQVAPVVGGPSYFNVNLHAVKWNRVDSVTVFIESNHGSANTFLHGLQIYGTPVHGTDVSHIRRAGGLRLMFNGHPIDM